MSLSKDKLHMVNAWSAVRTAYAAVNATQNEPAPEQVAAHAILFLALCRVLNIDPSQLIESAERMTATARMHYSLELRALEQYIAEEINK